MGDSLDKGLGFEEYINDTKAELAAIREEHEQFAQSVNKRRVSD
jgi:hypothetical protein